MMNNKALVFIIALCFLMQGCATALATGAAKSGAAHEKNMMERQ